MATDDVALIELPPGSGAQSLLMSVLNNDSDADNDTLTITSVTTPTNSASASIVTSATQIQVTNIQLGTTTFSYTISDGHGGTDSATVTIERIVESGGCPPDCN